VFVTTSARSCWRSWHSYLRPTQTSRESETHTQHVTSVTCFHKHTNECRAYMLLTVLCKCMMAQCIRGCCRDSNVKDKSRYIRSCCRKVILSCVPAAVASTTNDTHAAVCLCCCLQGSFQHGHRVQAEALRCRAPAAAAAAVQYCGRCKANCICSCGAGGVHACGSHVLSALRMGVCTQQLLPMAFAACVGCYA
jgi:hypothetical protein